MKKTFPIIVSILLLAAACGQQPVKQNNQTPPEPTPTPNSQSRIYENQYIKVTVPAGWALSEATRTIQNQNYDKNTGKTTLVVPPITEKTGAVNITKDAYILYINPQAGQASGVEGGRFAEIAGGAPSADAVVIQQPSPPCGKSEIHPAILDHPRVDLYVGPKDNDGKPYCQVPTNGKTVWYFSYITNSNNSYFNYYKAGEVLSYVITMAYNSKDINSFPVKGSAELNARLDEMTGIVKSLVIKQK